jgi:hypothetical protein
MQKNTKDKIIQRAILLSKFCMNDTAWKKKDALELVNNILDDESFGILGGEVYKVHIRNFTDNNDKLLSIKNLENSHRQEVEENDTPIFLSPVIYDLQTLGDNWSCEPIAHETKKEFFLRSKLETLKYIKSYPVLQGDLIIFSISFTENNHWVEEWVINIAKEKTLEDIANLSIELDEAKITLSPQDTNLKRLLNEVVELGSIYSKFALTLLGGGTFSNSELHDLNRIKNEVKVIYAQDSQDRQIQKEMLMYLEKLDHLDKSLRINLQMEQYLY